MTISVKIYTPDKGLGLDIIITPLEYRNGYSYIMTGATEKEDIDTEGVIFNFTGDYLELVTRILDGEVTRKD